MNPTRRPIPQAAPTTTVARFCGVTVPLLEINGILRLLAPQNGSEVLRRERRHLVSGLDRGAADVRGEDYVLEFEELRVNFRFFFVDVETGGEDASLSEGFG